MCGITSYIGENAFKHILDSLIQLQNRGYDSAGICSIRNSNFVVTKLASTATVNAINELSKYSHMHENTKICIGHTRWATHGHKTDDNAHPHVDCYNLFSLVHNGIIENYDVLKTMLINQGLTFKSQTDTEVIVNLIAYEYNKLPDSQNKVEDAIKNALEQIEGTYALCIYYINKPDIVYCIRHGSPLLVGIENNYAYITSEASGFSNRVTQYICINNNDLCKVSYIEGKLSFISGNTYVPRTHNVDNYHSITTPAPYSHWLIKEINEQSIACQNAMGNGGRIKNDHTVKLGGLDSHKELLLNVTNIILLGCGTSYHSGLVATYMFRDLCNFNVVFAYDAGEFTDDHLPKVGKSGVIFVSQSGETKDLHRCVEICKETKKDIIMIGVINVIDSQIAREVDCGVYLNAGKEVAVASTKAFSSQVTVLSLIALWFAQEHNWSFRKREKYIKNIKRLPIDISNAISMNEEVAKSVAQYLVDKNSMFILGKGVMDPISKEGSLKIKEVGYIHSEGYNLSSLKHGPYSLLVPDFPVILINMADSHFSKNQGVKSELISRNACVIGISDGDLDDEYTYKIKIPRNDSYNCILSVIPMQLISYHLALYKGIHPDMPRNLAKVVTVD